MDQYIQQALVGDEIAIQMLTIKHKPRLLAKAYAYVKNEQDAQDIVQETFIKAFQSLHQLKEPKYFATWLFKILIHESFRALKKKERIVQVETELIEQMLIEQQEGSTDFSHLHSALASLQKDYQMALILHYFYDFKVLEIAEMLNRPTNTVKMHLHRGRKALRLKLEQTMHQPLQTKDVKRMLKKQLFELASKYAATSAQYKLEVEDYREGRAAFMWQGENKEDGIFIVLDDQGRIDNLSKTPTLEGPPLTEEEKKQIAEKLLSEQYPKALNYYSLHEQKRKESSTQFYYNQMVEGLPLDQYYCRIEVTDPGEVIDFTYTGYLENPPRMPEVLYDPQHIFDKLYSTEWQLRAEFFDARYDSVPETGIYVVYETELLTQSFDAVTGKTLIESVENIRRSYLPFPNVDALPKKQTIEEIVGITNEWERFDEPSLDAEYERFNWRRKDWQEPENKTFNDYISRKFDNQVKAKVDPETKQLKSFIWFTEIEGDLQLTDHECLHIAAQFVQTYFERFVPYLKVIQNKEEDLETGRSTFRFAIEKEGMIIEHQYFQVGVNKQTGQVTMFSTPDISVEQLAKFDPSNIRPFDEIVPLRDVKVKRKWSRIYDDEVTEYEQNKLIYRIVTTSDALVQGVNAQTGEIIYSLL